MIADVVVSVVMLVLAIGVHEWAHVATARWFGDPTGERMGRLTLNPLAHADPIWTIALPAFLMLSGSPVMFGAGKPAPYNATKFSREFDGKRVMMGTAELFVALAGPMSNLALAVLTTLLVIVGIRAGGSDAFVSTMFQFITLNVGLLLFNMVPVPPLDGSKVLFNLLPRPLALKYEAACQALSWLLLAALVMGGARIVLSPFHRVITGLLVRLIELAT